MTDRRTTHYSLAMQTLHWLTAVIVLAAFIYGPGGSEALVYAAAQDFERQLHETLGLCVFSLALIRIVWRALGSHPAPPSAPAWLTLAARLVQIALYALLVAVPITAIAGAWLEGHALTLLAGLTIPPAMGESHALGGKIAAIHTWLGDAIVWLAGVHAAAGLFHHYVIKDDVLRSMLPHRGADGA